jgi:hypothetical protein
MAGDASPGAVVVVVVRLGVVIDVSRNQGGY